MALVNRPNGPTDFTDDPAVDPATGAKIDAELNAMIAVINDLDNANISGTPKIDASKIDLASGGYVSDAGDEITGPLEHIFDGTWRKMRSSGNARIYEGTADVLWCLSYNTEYSSGAWQGRDVTGACFKFTLDSDGYHMYHAVSASSDTVPTWSEIFHVDTAGGVGAPVTVGNYLCGRTTAEASGNESTYVMIQEFYIAVAGNYRVIFSSHSYTGEAGNARLYVNDDAVGTNRLSSSSTYVEYSEDIAITADSLLQLRILKAAGNPMYVKEFRVLTSKAIPQEAALLEN